MSNMTKCPACPDGNQWGPNGPTGKACPTCHGSAYIAVPDAGFDEWIARELPRATGYEIDLCRTVWIAALASIPKVTAGASLLRSPAKVIAGEVPAAGRPNPTDFRSYEKATQQARDSGDGSYPDLEEPSDYCECGAVHTGLEDGGRCEACGKII